MTPTSTVFLSGYAPASQPGLHACRFDAASGVLTPVASHAGILNPSFLVLHPRKPVLYAVSETGLASDGVAGSVWALRLAGDPPTFTPLNQQPSGGDWPCHLSLDPSGNWLFVANYGSGSVVVLPVQADGSLGTMTDLVQHQGSGPNAARQEAAHAHSATPSPDGRFVIVADLGLDQLVVYRFDRQAGRLTPHQVTATRPGAGPRHVVFHPNGRCVYLANELDNTVSLYDYHAANGTLRERQTLPTLPPAAPENTVADIHLAADGGRLYVSNRGHNSLAVYDVAGDGGLTALAFPPCGGAWPRNFALAPGGRWALVANQHSGAVATLPLLGAAPGVGQAVARLAVAGASCVRFAGANEGD
ncbi:MAG: lactonase family protein [Chloroflexaceae bacterium]|jgi:6-phosphogluconolactonase|nr:lactonase family protein [Chloroflexaceae bacterium]